MESRLKATEWPKVIYLIFNRAETRNQGSQSHVPWGLRCRTSPMPVTVFPQLGRSLKQIEIKKLRGRETRVMEGRIWA